MIAPQRPQLPSILLDWQQLPQSGVWHQLRGHVEAETGMSFAGIRESRLLDAVRHVLASATSNLDELPSLLEHPERRGRFLEQVSAELTVGESYFLRNEHHFRALRERVLPDILRHNESRRELRIWSAGCATGEEPYSVAILLDQLLGVQLGAWRISILATDLNPTFLERAQSGLYRMWSFRHSDIHNDRRYFSPECDCFRLAPRLRNSVRFAYLNLVKDIYPSASTGTLGVDLILFRNVAIYLRPEVTAAIIARFHRALRPDGRLLLGETEVNQASTTGFQAERFGQATFHRRVESGTAGICNSTLGTAPLADIMPQTTAVVPRVRSLPVWTPLPAIRSAEPSPPPRGRDSAVPAGPPAPVAAPDATASNEMEPAASRGNDRTSCARSRLAQCKSLLAFGETAKAHEFLAACLQDDPLLLEAQLLAAAVAEDAGDMEAAEKAYRRAIYIDRGCAMSHFHLGLLLERQGKRELGRKCLDMASALTVGKPADACVPHSEGICYGRLCELIAILIHD